MLRISPSKKCYFFLKKYVIILSKLPYSDSAIVKVDLPLKIKDFCDDFDSDNAKKEFPKDFIQDLFINKFQEKVLEYPELKSLRQVESLKRQCYLAQRLLIGENEKTLVCNDHNSSVNVLRTHELTGFKLPRSKKGFGYAGSEFSLMQETLASNPSLSKSVSENDDFGAQLISDYGSASQKKEYMTKLATGEIVSSFAHTESEPFVTLDPDLIDTTAKLSEDQQSFVITGKKNWVYNAKYADLFILSANVVTKNPDGTQNKKPTLFLIPKDVPGVKIHEPIDIIALKNLSISDVTFDKVVVPLSSVLGKVQDGGNIIRKLMSLGKLNNGAYCLPVMRHVVNKAIKHCIHTDFFKKTKYELDYYKMFIGEISSQVYAVESMTYLVTGRLDMYHNPDLFLESLITKIYASENLLSVLHKCMRIIGPEIISDEPNWSEILKNSEFYAASDITNDHLRLALAITGVQHALDHEKKKTFVRRKTLYTVSKLLNMFEDYDSRLKTTGILQGFVHCIFHFESEILEDGVNWLYESTRDLIDRHGDNIFERHWELKILAEMAILIYAEVAVLGRASRAYCLGVKLAEADRSMAEAIMKTYFYRINRMGRILKNERRKIDKISRNLMNLNSGYKSSVLESLRIRN